MLSVMIDAHRGIPDVATADVAGAYLKAYMTDFVVMKFTWRSGGHTMQNEQSTQKIRCN
jgi:hypothetical protein